MDIMTMRLIVYILLLMISTTAYSQAEQKYVRRGNKNYEDQRYQEAEINYRRALEKNPESVKANFNLGNSMYKQDRYEAAAARYNNLLKKNDDRTELSKYFFNLGNTLFRTQKFKESIEAYKNALLNNPDDLDAKHNLQMALKMLKENNQTQGQDQKDNQEQNNRQKEDQQQDQQANARQNQQDSYQDQQNNEDRGNMDLPPQERGQISPEDAERLLQALENEEKETLKKIQEQQMQVRKIPVDKNW